MMTIGMQLKEYYRTKDLDLATLSFATRSYPNFDFLKNADISESLFPPYGNLR